jgi:hypothetical protein
MSIVRLAEYLVDLLREGGNIACRSIPNQIRPNPKVFVADNVTQICDLAPRHVRTTGFQLVAKMRCRVAQDLQ